MDRSEHCLPSRRGVLGGSIAAAATLWLAGCSDSAPAATQGAAGKRLRLSVDGDPALSRILGITPGNTSITRSIFDPLLERLPDGSYKPSLASEWAWNDDKTTLKLKLRDGVTFHSGRALTAEDVVATMTMAAKPTSGVQMARLLSRTSSIKASGDREVTVTMDKPFVGILDAFAAIPIIDSTTFDDLESATKVIGTGPFVWKSWTPGKSIVLDRNPSYWNKDHPFLAGLDMSIIGDGQAVVAALKAGDVALATKVLARDAATLAEDSRFTVPDGPGQDLYVGVNVTTKPLDDVRVRRAIGMALDRKRIADQVFKGYATPSCVPWAAGTPGVTAAQVDHFAYDVAAAKALVTEAGAAGAEVTIAARANNPSFVAVADIVYYGLQQIGLKPKIIKIDAPAYAEMMQGGTFTGLWVGNVGLTLVGQLTALLTANPFVIGKNTSKVSDPAYAGLVNGVVDAVDDAQRAQASAALTDYLLDQAFHLTVVQEQPPMVGVKALTGVEVDPLFNVRYADAKLAS